MTTNVRRLNRLEKIALAMLMLCAMCAGLVSVATITAVKDSVSSTLTLENIHYTDVTIYVGNNGDMVSFCAVKE